MPFTDRQKTGEHLTEKQLKYAVRVCMDGKRMAAVAVELGVGQKRIRHICTVFRKMAKIPVLRHPGRWKKPTSTKDTAVVLNEHAVNHVGVL